MIKTNNPAGRLHEILAKAKANGAGTGFTVWSRAFDLNLSGNNLSADEIKVTNCVLELYKLIDEVEVGLRKVEGINLDLYLRPFPRIREVIRLNNLSISNFSEVLKQITEGDMTVLAFCAEELSKWQSEQVIEEEQIKELLDNINALYEEVKVSLLKEELKNLILEQLELIRRAIHEYRIRGIERLREALTTAVGAYVLNQDLIESEVNKEEVSKFKGFLSKFASTVAFASHTTRLIEAAAKYLPLLLP